MRLRLTAFAALLSFCGAAHAKGDGVVTIPMTYDRYLFVHPMLNDTVQGRFMFDTGAQLCLLDSSWVARHGLRFAHVQTATMLGTGNREQDAGYVTDTLAFRLGSHSYTSSPNVIAPLSGLLPGIDGLINATAFEDRIFTIDYDANTIRVLPRSALDTLLNEERYQRIPFTTDNGNFPVLPLTVVLDSARNRTIGGQVRIDTGDPGSLTLLASGAQLDRWKEQAVNWRSLSVSLLGVGGGGRVSVIRTEALGIGEAEIPAHELTVLEESQARNDDRIGAVGNALLSQFGSVVFDMRERNIYLPRGRRFRNKDRVDYSGIPLSRTDRWFVNGDSGNGSAKVRNGDVVTHIDDRPIDDMAQEAHDSYFCTPDRSYTLTLLREGETLRIPVTNLNDETLWH